MLELAIDKLLELDDSSLELNCDKDRLLAEDEILVSPVQALSNKHAYRDRHFGIRKYLKANIAISSVVGR